MPRTVPSVPRSLTATPGYNQMTLRWAAPASTGGAPITGYTISYAPSGGTWTSVNVSASTRSRTITGLRGGTTYYFRISAYNAAGRSPSTTSVKAVPDRLPQAGRRVDLLGDQRQPSVGLRWSPPTNTGGLPITRYVVQIGTNGVWRNLVTLPGTTTRLHGDGPRQRAHLLLPCRRRQPARLRVLELHVLAPCRRHRRPAAAACAAAATDSDV